MNYSLIKDRLLIEVCMNVLVVMQKLNDILPNKDKYFFKKMNGDKYIMCCSISNCNQTFFFKEKGFLKEWKSFDKSRMPDKICASIFDNPDNKKIIKHLDKILKLKAFW